MCYIRAPDVYTNTILQITYHFLNIKTHGFATLTIHYNVRQHRVTIFKLFELRLCQTDLQRLLLLVHNVVLTTRLSQS